MPSSPLTDVTSDVRHAIRMILKMPVVAIVVVLSLAIGIGVNTAVFSWIQAMVLKPLPGVVDASSLYLVEPRAETGSFPGASWLEYHDLRDRLQSFRQLLAFRMSPLNLGNGSRTDRVFGLLVSDTYFTALGLQPALGRFLRGDEAARPGGEPVVVISHDFWQTRFSGAPDAVGRTIRVNDVDLTIVGVTPAGFQGTVLMLNFDLWVPATMAPVLLAGSRELEDRAVRGYSVMGYLRPGATQAQAQSEFDTSMRELARIYPATNAAMYGEVRPFWRSPRGPQEMLARALGLLQAIMLLLLLAVCGNTANLLLARAGARQREVGIRLAVGAPRWRIVRLLLTESALLAIVGGLVGAAAAVWATEALRAVPLTGAFPIRFHTTVDAGGLLVAVGLGLACGMTFGLAPALQLATVAPHGALRHIRVASRRGMRNVLMASEVAVAVVVLVVAGLLVESFRETRDADPGFHREGLLLAAYDFTGRGANGSSAVAFASRLLDRLRSVPSIEAAAIATSVPLDIHGLPLRSFTLEGRARGDAAPDRALANTVTAGYLQAMGIPLVAGTDLANLSEPAPPPQAIVNEEFVRRYLPGAQAIGRRLQAGGRTFVIVGIARNSLYESFSEPATPIIYFSYRDRPSRAGEIHVRTHPGTEALAASDVRRIVNEIDPALPLYNVRTMAEHVEKNLFLRRIPARMFIVLGPLLLILSAVGIYAVVAYSVSHRTAEIGIRLALGATRQRIVSQIVGGTMWVIGVGAAAGLLVAYPLVSFARSTDPTVLVGIPLLLLTVSGFACWVPAQRAASIDPIVALRQEHQ